MKFRDFFSNKKQIIFSVCIVALMMVFAVRQSNNVVKVSFNDNSVFIKTARYNMDIHYADIDSVDLVPMEEPGEELSDAFDDDTLQVGTWRNDAWGEYTACIDPDTPNAIQVRIRDGRVLVFSRKNEATTTDIFETLQTYLSNP